MKKKERPGLGFKSFCMLNSTEHEIYPTQKVKISKIVGILTFISMLNTTSESLKGKKKIFIQHFSFNEHFQFLAHWSWA